MTAAAVLFFGLFLDGQVPASSNPVFRQLLDRGVAANGVTVPLPPPVLVDGQDAAAGRKVLGEIVGDDRSVANFVRDSVSAPFVLRTRDVPAGDATIRAADLYFVVRGDLDEVDLKQVLGKADESTVEAGNMRMTTRQLAAGDLDGRQLDRVEPAPGRDEWFTHATGRLLDRIAVESTDRAVATRTADSLTVAAATSRAFDADAAFPNRWSTIARAGAAPPRPAEVYPGGGSYVKITRLPGEAGVLFVEAHFAFVEPQAWFDGNPILRSKFSIICQDQVRQLRREIQKHRAKK